MVALIDKQRHADFRACLKRRWLRSVGGCVALKARIGLCDLKLNEKRRLDAEHVTLIRQNLHVHVFFHKLEVVAKRGSRDRNILIRLVIHKVIQIAVPVKILHVLALDGYLSVGLNVFSVTAPEITLRILVRTNAAPFPGFTCWNSIICTTFPSISNVTPFLKSPAEII